MLRILDSFQQYFNWLTTGDYSMPPVTGGVLQRRPQASVQSPVSDMPTRPPAIVEAAPNAGPPAAPFPPPPPMNGLNVMNMNPAPPAMTLLEELNSAAAKEIRLSAHMRARQEDGGHVFARHGPSLTDQQLMDRLLTGLDHEGEIAPTSGVSSRFASREMFVGTFKTVHQSMTQALANTRAYLRDPIALCAELEADFLTAAPAARAAVVARRGEAYNDLRQSLLAVNSMTHHLPVQWDAVRRCVTLYSRYTVKHPHYKQLGHGYYGTGPKPNTLVMGCLPKGLGTQREMQIYDRAHLFNGPAQHTLTVFVAPDEQHNAFGLKHDISTWPLITHYPQHDNNMTVVIIGR